MAQKPSKPKKKAPEFEASPEMDQALNEKPKRELSQNDIKNHSKFDKFKGEKINGN